MLITLSFVFLSDNIRLEWS